MMPRSWKTRLWTAAVAVWAMLLPVATVLAQGPEAVRELVYHVNAYQGHSWTGVFYPQSEATLYLYAGQFNTITPRYTMVYFWPITQRYLADWSRLDEAIVGQLEVRRAGQVVQTFDLEDYVLQDPTGGGGQNTLVLYRGQEAHSRFQAYSAALEAFWDAEADYVLGAENGAASEAPTPPALFSTKVLQGFLVDLAPGTYQAVLRGADGEPVPGGEKTLVVIAPRRTGIGYDIIPEPQWTVPEHSSTPEQTIYAGRRTRLFFQPQVEAEFNAHDYDQLLDPQAPAGDETTWKWVALGHLDAPALHYSAAGGQAPVARRGYEVVQLSGSAYGYEIRAVEESDAPAPATFSAYEVTVALEAGELARLWLVDQEGRVIEGSQRTLRGVRAPAGNWVLLPALVPLLAAGLFARRRRRRQSKPDRASQA